MVSSPRPSIGGIVVATALGALVAMGIPGPSNATPAWLKNVLSGGHAGDGRTAPAPPVAKYQMEQGNAFVLDRSSRPPLLKFDDSPEIWALTASRGPRGDILYSNDIGMLMVRSTKLGGLTIYTSDRPEGAAAAVIGPATSFRTEPVSAFVLEQRLALDSMRCSRVARRTLGFAALDADAKSSGIILDAAINVVEAVAALPNRPGGRPILARVSRIMFNVSDQPHAGLQNGTLSIDVAPSRGFAGRPSSARILLSIGAP